MFLAESLRHGLTALLQQYTGYYHTVPRLVTYLGHQLPIPYYAYFVTLFCSGFAALVFAWFARTSYRPYVPSDFLRLLTGVAMCVMPGLHEVVDNLANIHWVLYLLVALIALKPHHESLEWWEWGLAVLALLSSGEAIVLAPLLIARERLRILEGLNPRGLSATGSLVLILGAVAALNFLQREFHPGGARPGIATMMRHLSDTVAGAFVYQPVFGEHVTQQIAATVNRPLFLVFASLAILPSAFHLWRSGGRSGRLLLLLTTCTLMVPVLTWLVRPGAEILFSQAELANPELGWWQFRYAVQLAPFAILFWIGLLGGPGTDRLRMHRHGLATLVLGFYVLHASYRFTLDIRAAELDWYRDSEALDRALRTGCPHEVDVPISPTHWKVHYRVPNPPASCR